MVAGLVSAQTLFEEPTNNLQEKVDTTDMDRMLQVDYGDEDEYGDEDDLGLDDLDEDSDDYGDEADSGADEEPEEEEETRPSKPSWGRGGNTWGGNSWMQKKKREWR